MGSPTSFSHLRQDLTPTSQKNKVLELSSKDSTLLVTVSPGISGLYNVTIPSVGFSEEVNVDTVHGRAHEFITIYDDGLGQGVEVRTSCGVYASDVVLEDSRLYILSRVEDENGKILDVKGF